MKSVIFLLIIIIFCSYRSSDKYYLSDFDTWILSWRMFESYQNKEYELAEIQFDSLSFSSQNIRPKFIKIGLKLKKLRGKNEEVANILSNAQKITWASKLVRQSDSIFFNLLPKCRTPVENTRLSPARTPFFVPVGNRLYIEKSFC